MINRLQVKKRKTFDLGKGSPSFARLSYALLAQEYLKKDVGGIRLQVTDCHNSLFYVWKNPVAAVKELRRFVKSIDKFISLMQIDKGIPTTNRSINRTYLFGDWHYVKVLYNRHTNIAYLKIILDFRLSSVSNKPESKLHFHSDGVITGMFDFLLSGDGIRNDNASIAHFVKRITRLRNGLQAMINDIQEIYLHAG